MSRYKGRVSASAIERIFRMWSKLSCLRRSLAIRTRIMKITRLCKHEKPVDNEVK